MSRATALRQLTDRLLRIEEEIRTVRDDLEALRRREPVSNEVELRRAAGSSPFRVDKASLRQWADDLFEALGIEGRALPPESLQQVARASGLEPDELSRSLIAARDE